MPCAKCHDLCIRVRIRSPQDLERAIRIASQNVQDGTIVEVEEPNPQVTTSFSTLAKGALWDDLVSFRFKCASCEEEFSLSAETYHGSGGYWQPVIQALRTPTSNIPKQLTGYEKKVADLQGKIAGKVSEVLRKLSELDRNEKQAQRHKEQEERRRQDQQLRHSKQITRELERQSQIHNQLASTPIIVKFADLPKKITVLFIASNPGDQTQLKLDEEIRAITKKIRESKFRDAVELKAIWATRPDDLLQALNEHKPTVVHFSGHGSDQGELVLQDDSGGTKLISLEAIVQLFKVMASGIELVVFNACYSYAQAAEVTNHVKAAIGMSDAVRDDAARVFAAQLYSAIGFGRSVCEAFEQAKVALQLEGIPEEDIPELYLAAGVENESLVLVQPQT